MRAHANWCPAGPGQSWPGPVRFRYPRLRERLQQPQEGATLGRAQGSEDLVLNVAEDPVEPFKCGLAGAGQLDQRPPGVVGVRMAGD
jgi:hypothetical protein